MSNEIACGCLPKQFLLTRKSMAPPAGWSILPMGDHRLYKSPELPATPIVPQGSGAQAKPVGYVLGWFSLAGNFYPGVAPARLEIASVDDVYHDMTGRFAILVRDGSRLRCVTDPGALLPAVYRPNSDEVASTPRALALSEPVFQDLNRRRSFERADGTAWYPFGVTPFAGIERIMPGRVLELPSGTVRRVTDSPLAVSSPAETVRSIFARASEFVQAAAQTGPLEAHLTAGWDSRMVLAAALAASADVDYLTYRTPGSNGGVDCLVAELIARRLSLPHRQILLQAPRQADLDAWTARTSGCIRDSVMNLTTTVAATYSDRYVLGGLAGEVGRAFYWNESDIGGRAPGPEELLRRLGFPASKLALDLAARWLAGYDGRDRPFVLDQAYVDLRLGGWAGPSLYGHPVSKPSLTPFNNARVYALMRSLPERDRTSGRFARDFVALGSPLLADIPVNRAYGVNRVRFLKRELGKLLPPRAKASLRAMIGG